MLRYFARRILLMIPTFLGITLVCFALTQFVPGGPVEQRLAAMRGLSGGSADAAATSAASASPAAAGDEYRRMLNERYGFDKPLHVRYFNWLVRDRCGLRMHSYHYTDKTAGRLIASRIPVSLWFGIPGFILTYLVCIPLGIAKALRNGTKFDLLSSALVFVGYALPTFALGMLLKTWLCGSVDGLPALFPLGGFESDGAADMTAGELLLDRARHMALPVACYMAGSFAMLTLLAKNSLLDQLSADYVRTVLAKGATMRRAVWRHALRNSLIPVATGIGSVLGVFFAGSVIIENVFEIPGMGLLSLESLLARDYPVFLGLLSVTSLLGLFGQVISDAACAVVDPRIKFSARK